MPQGLFSIELKNNQQETKKLCHVVEALGQTLGLSGRTVFGITLALEELFTNIVSYAFTDSGEHRICISIAKENETLVIRIEDDGLPFDPVQAKAPELGCSLEESAVGGLGIHIAKKMMDAFSYERKKNRNITTLRKNIARTRKQDGGSLCGTTGCNRGRRGKNGDH